MDTNEPRDRANEGVEWRGVRTAARAWVGSALSATLLGLTLCGAACESLEFADDDSGVVSLTPTGPESGDGGEPVSRSGLDDSPLFDAPATGSRALFDACEAPAAGVEVETRAIELPFGDAVSTASASWARAMLAARLLPDPNQLRLGELAAYLRPNPASVFEWAPSLQLFPASVDPGPGEVEVVLRFSTPSNPSTPTRLLVVLDRSHSMRESLGLQSELLSLLGAQLPESWELGVLGYAEGAELLLAPRAGGTELSDALDSLDVIARGTHDGNRPSEGLLATLPWLDTPMRAHVLFVSDGGAALDTSLLESAQAVRASGAELSVLLLGKPGAEAVPVRLGFARAFADALVPPGTGAKLYAGDAHELEHLLGAAGVVRTFGNAGAARGMSVDLPIYFEPLLESGIAGPSLHRLAPGRTYVARMSTLFCDNAALDESATSTYLRDFGYGLQLEDLTYIQLSVVSAGTQAPDALERLDRLARDLLRALRQPASEEARMRVRDAALGFYLPGDDACVQPAGGPSHCEGVAIALEMLEALDAVAPLP